MTKQRCENCNWHGTSDEVLRAPNPFDSTSPFDATDELWGCPDCKAVNELYLVCDEPDCWEYASYGTPTSKGYRSTCRDHQPNDAEGTA